MYKENNVISSLIYNLIVIVWFGIHIHDDHNFLREITIEWKYFPSFIYIQVIMIWILKIECNRILNLKVAKAAIK